jgi:hypothetical protein
MSEEVTVFIGYKWHTFFMGEITANINIIDEEHYFLVKKSLKIRSMRSHSLGLHLHFSACFP